MRRIPVALAAVAAVLLVVAALTGAASAADTPDGLGTSGERRGPCLGLSLGGVFPGGLSDRTFLVQSAGFTAAANQGFTLDAGFGAGAQVGCRLDRWRAEGEFLYQSFGRNDTTFTLTTPGAAPLTFAAGGTQVDVYALFANGYYDFPSSSRFSPYLGVGLGHAWLNAGVVSAANGVVRTAGLDQSAFAYQLKAGVSYDVSESTSAFLQYRFTGTSGFRYGGATVTTGGQTFSIAPATGSLNNHTLELGARFNL